MTIYYEPIVTEFHVLPMAKAKKQTDDEPRSAASPAGRSSLSLPLDFYETESNYFVHAECPGLKKEEIVLNVEGKVLALGFDKKEPKPEGSKKYTGERVFGKFERRITMPKDCDMERCEAKYEDGVLRLAFAKQAVQKRTITIE